MTIGGVFIGVLSGLFGGGGGMLGVPLLRSFGLDVKKSHATCIAIILPLCAVASVGYWISGHVDLSIAWKVEIGVLIGGIVGALALKKISSKVLSFAFYALMIYAGVRSLCK